MVSYEVTVSVDEGLEAQYERYMRERHIPQIMATGCFHHTVFERGDDGRFRTRYVAETRADLDRYLRDHTTAFRNDFAQHFPTGAAAARAVYGAVQEWTRP